MSNKTSTLPSKELGSFEPFTSKPKGNLFYYKLGQKLGHIFVSAKKMATNRYLDVTKGINQRIEDEHRAVQEEIFYHLSAQAEEFEQEIRHKRKRWMKVSFGLMMLSLCVGAIGTYFII